MRVIAKQALHHGSVVPGTDALPSQITHELAKLSYVISSNPANELAHRANLIVHSAALPESTVGLRKARLLSASTLTYAVAVGEVTREHRTIAVCGSHGKRANTASSISLTLLDESYDPTVIIGTKFTVLQYRNYRPGTTEWFLVEADEYYRASPNYSPYTIVTLGIDNNHMDVYHDVGGDSAAVSSIICRLRDDNYSGNERSRFLAHGGGEEPAFARSPIRPRDTSLSSIHLPDHHNQINDDAANHTSRSLGIACTPVLLTFSRLSGTWGRLELVWQHTHIQMRLYFNYVHQPAAIREQNRTKRMIRVLEPHQSERLNRLLLTNSMAFSRIDDLVTLPIHPIRGRGSSHRKSEQKSRLLSLLQPQAGNSQPSPRSVSRAKNVTGLKRSRSPLLTSSLHSDVVVMSTGPLSDWPRWDCLLPTLQRESQVAQ